MPSSSPNNPVYREQSVVCPTCRTRIDPAERCTVSWGHQCMDRQGHSGWHWYDAATSGGITRWTGDFILRDVCAGRLGENIRWCVKPARHDGAHNDGQGTSFGDPYTPCEHDQDPSICEDCGRGR